MRDPKSIIKRKVVWESISLAIEELILKNELITRHKIKLTILDKIKFPLKPEAIKLIDELLLLINNEE